jgi:hypothetical protein
MHDLDVQGDVTTSRPKANQHQIKAGVVLNPVARLLHRGDTRSV